MHGEPAAGEPTARECVSCDAVLYDGVISCDLCPLGPELVGTQSTRDDIAHVRDLTASYDLNLSSTWCRVRVMANDHLASLRSAYVENPDGRNSGRFDRA